MQIKFTVNQISAIDTSHSRAAHLPEGTPMTLLRLRPVEEDHRKTVGDVMVAAPTAECSLFVEEIIDRAPLAPGDGRTEANLGKVLQEGTTATLTIG